MCGQTWNGIHGLPMRQSEEDTIEITQLFNLFRRSTETEISKSGEITVNIYHGFAGVFIRGDKRDFSIGVEQKNAEQLGSAVTGAAKDTDVEFAVLHRLRFSLCILCVLCVSVVNSLGCQILTTETQRTQRMHGEESHQLFRFRFDLRHYQIKQNGAFAPRVSRRNLKLTLDVVFSHSGVCHRARHNINLYATSPQQFYAAPRAYVIRSAKD